jgi:hypothetical protein
METNDTATVRLNVELFPSGGGLYGRLTDETGTARPFTGWLGLLTLLEAARVATTTPTPTETEL